MAKKTPFEFIENFLPLIIKIVHDNSDPTGDLPYLDKIFYYRQYGGSYCVPSTLLRAITIALEQIAKENPDKLRAIITGLEEYKDSDTIQFLITCAYTANGVEFADDAVEYLFEKHSRLHSGYSGDGHWATRLLIAAIAENCKFKNYKRLEEHILSYHTKWEMSAGGYKSYGWAQFELLNALPACRKSIKAQSRIDEWRRKFLVDDVEPPEPMEFKVVESPVAENAQLKMTDEQWKRAIAKYNNEDHYKFSCDMRRNVLQFSAVLENATKREPIRFANLGIQLPDDTHPYYFNATLRGLKETANKLEDVLPFCYRCHRLPNKPCGQWIHEPIAKFASDKIPEEALQLVGWYATEDSDPEKEMWKTKAGNSSDYYYGGDILTAAINSVRGSACESLSKLVRHDKKRIPQLIPYIEKAVSDSNISVRCTAASIVLAILEHDSDLAINLFILLCNNGDELLGTHYIEYFLNYGAVRYYDKIKPTLVRMLHSQIPTVKQAGSRQICVSALFHSDAIEYADNCITGEKDLQYGVAQVCAVNVHKKDFSWFLIPRLIILFNSEYKEVRNEACRCFHYFTGDMVGLNTALIEAYINSKAFLEDPFSFMHALEETTSKIPVSIIQIAEKVVSEIKGGTKNQDRYSTIDKICKLLMRVYCDSTEPEIIKRCLDCFDEYLQLGVYGITDVLSSQDR